VLLFGLPSTVIGFYFGSRATSDSQAGAATPLRLTLSGVPLANSQAIAVVDRNGKAEFDFSAAISPATQGTYILRVQSPSIVQCDERITLGP
jgi:hypothetical protein